MAAGIRVRSWVDIHPDYESELQQFDQQEFKGGFFKKENETGKNYYFAMRLKGGGCGRCVGCRSMKKSCTRHSEENCPQKECLGDTTKT